LGIHNITLKIIQPQVEYPIPTIRYFVSLGKYEVEKIEFQKIEVKTLGGEIVKVEENKIKAPKAKHFIFEGKIKNNLEEKINYALLRIYIENELIDQKILKDFKKDDEVNFETSILVRDFKGERIYILLYDITSDKPKLIYLKKYLLTFF